MKNRVEKSQEERGQMQVAWSLVYYRERQEDWLMWLCVGRKKKRCVKGTPKTLCWRIVPDV